MVFKEQQYPISAVVIARNEENRIAATVQRLLWCREVIVVDDCSTDSTREVARNAGARVVRVERGAQPLEWLHFRGFENAREPWILKLDADEVVSPNLVRRLQQIVSGGDERIRGYKVARLNIFMGHPLRFGGMRRPEQLKFFRADSWSTDWDCAIHSQVPVLGPIKKIRPRQDRVVVHPLYDSFGTFLEKSLLKYAYQEARETLAVKIDVKDIVPVLTRCAVTTFWMTFLKRGIGRMGILDGWHGVLWIAYLSTYRSAVYLHAMDQRFSEGEGSPSVATVDSGKYFHR